MASPVKRNPVGPLRFAELVRINEALFFDKTRPPAIEPLFRFRNVASQSYRFEIRK